MVLNFLCEELDLGVEVKHIEVRSLWVGNASATVSMYQSMVQVVPIMAAHR